jgi:ferredoxin--NADP+ reductase
VPPVEGVPFDQRSGVIPNVGGRVTDPATGKPVPGLYVSGWIKRGPSGVIGTNKKDGTETATAMLEDAVAAAAASFGITDPAVVETLVRGRQPDCVSYADWARLDAIEVKLGEPHGRPRLKVVTRAAVKEALSKENHA